MWIVNDGSSQKVILLYNIIIDAGGPRPSSLPPTGYFSPSLSLSLSLTLSLSI